MLMQKDALFRTKASRQLTLSQFGNNIAKRVTVNKRVLNFEITIHLMVCTGRTEIIKAVGKYLCISNGYMCQ